MKALPRGKALALPIAAAVLLSALSPMQAGAATTVTASIAVTANVSSTCAVTALPILFGIYSPNEPSNNTAQTTVVVTCTNGTPYNVGLDAGTGTGATVAVRKMTSGANTLNYSLYQDSGYSTVWGTTIGTNTKTGTGTGLSQTINVYGSVTASQSAVVGVYTDTVAVSLTY